jgi:hypothetical protein
MTPRSTPQLAARFLGASDIPDALRGQSAARAWRDALDALLPLDLLTATHFIRLDGHVLWLRADSPAVATRVRQIQARLRRGLAEHGLAVSAVKVKVGSPRFRRIEPPPKPARVMPEPARNSLEAVAARLPDGPLRAALLRLARTGA